MNGCTTKTQAPARWRERRPNSLACLQGLESLAPFSRSTVVGSVAVEQADDVVYQLSIVAAVLPLRPISGQ